MSDVWIIITGLAIGTFLIRFSFLGIIGGRDLPDWMTRHLRYVSVAVLPGLIAPLVVWPAANNGEPEPARLIATGVAIGVGIVFRSVIWAIISGFATLYVALALLY
ncbi:MAG: AzlD domain-containing protein [Pseudomonadota bacterium]